MKENNEQDDHQRSTSAAATTTLQSFSHKYKDAILFNKNLLIADTCSLFASSLFAEIYFKLANVSYITDSIYTALVEYGVDTPIFFVLYYIDNRSKYVLQDESDSIPVGRRKKKDALKIRNDIKRLLGAFSLCDIMYVVIKIFVQYQILQLTNLQPYQAAMASSLIGWAAFLVLINISMRAIKVFSKNEIVWYYALILAINISNSVIVLSNLALRAFYDNTILDISAAVAVSSVFIVVFRQKLIHKIWDKTFSSLATGLVLWFTAEMIWTYYQLGLGINNPFPSTADAFWLIGYGFLIYHVYRITSLIRTTAASTYSRRNIFAISIIALIIMASSYLAGIVIFGGTNPFSQGKEELIKFLISIAYPILDAVLVVPALTILWSLRIADPVFTHWILICAFIVMSAIGDIGFAYSEMINEEIAHKQVWIWDTFFNAAYLCIAGALFWYNKFSIVDVVVNTNGNDDKDLRRNSW